jgi:hypothetical protein
LNPRLTWRGKLGLMGLQALRDLSSAAFDILAKFGDVISTEAALCKGWQGENGQ